MEGVLKKSGFGYLQKGRTYDIEIELRKLLIPVAPKLNGRLHKEFLDRNWRDVSYPVKWQTTPPVVILNHILALNLDLALRAP
jgi:hypothetical protein